MVSFDELERRLIESDESALEDVRRSLCPLVRKRLRSRFQGSLSEADLDDVLSTAIYRLWMYRDRFDPNKGRLPTWFYIIARSAAIDFLRAGTRQQFQHVNDHDIEEASVRKMRDESTVRELKETPTLTIEILRAAIAKLPALDQEILLAFANSNGESNWAANLAPRLRMPPSTIRSRKFRALDKVRTYFQTAENRL